MSALQQKARGVSTGSGGCRSQLPTRAGRAAPQQGSIPAGMRRAGPDVQVMDAGGPGGRRWTSGTGLLGGQQNERFAGVSRWQGVGTVGQRGTQRRREVPLLRESQLRARATSVNLCGHKPAGRLGLPQRHTRACAAHGARLGLSQPPVGWELGRAELMHSKFRK